MYISDCLKTFEPKKFDIYSARQNDLLSFVKDVYVDGKKLARNGRKTDI